MKKITNFIAATLLLTAMLFSNTALAQPPASCDPCPGVPWGSTTTTSFTFSLPAYPGCMYKGYVKYRTRSCLGKTQVQIVGRPVFEELMPGCQLHCLDANRLQKAVYNQMFSLLGGLPIIKVEESPCHYTGEIIVPPGAEVCYGMTPGTRKVVTMPCDNNGCCYSELTPAGGGGVNQNVISSTPCPATPYTPPTAEIEWECDILGGGSAKFTVTFIPDTPLICTNTCYTGFLKPAKSTSVIELSENTLSYVDVYPNPVTDVLHVSFKAKAGMTVDAELIDITGKAIVTKQITTEAGQQAIDIDMEHLPSGTYGLRLIYDSGHVMTKVIK